MARDGQAGENFCAFADLGKVLFGIAHAAAFVGAKGGDALAAEIIMLQKCENAHRRRAAPAGEADKNGAIGRSFFLVRMTGLEPARSRVGT